MDRASGFTTDTVVALTVSLVYSIAKVGHAIDGRVGIPGGPTVVTDATAGSGEVARQQWVLVALGVVAAMVALPTGGELASVLALMSAEPSAWLHRFPSRRGPGGRRRLGEERTNRRVRRAQVIDAS